MYVSIHRVHVWMDINKCQYVFWLPLGQICVLVHGAKASRHGVSATKLSGSSRDLGCKISINPYWNLAAEEYSSNNKPSPHWFSWTNSPNSSICFDFAPLWDVQLQWHRRSHGSKKYSSAGGGSPPGLPSLPPALRNKLMIAVAVGNLGVLWNITVWAVHSRKNTLGNFHRHGKPPRVPSGNLT